jgi:4-amino-4-deoxy-L-arabinose transferase
LALLIGHAVEERLRLQQGRALGINGWLNVVMGAVALIALAWLQLKKPVYDHEPTGLLLMCVALVGWTVANLAQALSPLRRWAAPVLGSLLLMALLPAALPKSVEGNKMPDQFILQHLDELAGATHLMSNDLGAASALAWRLKQPNVAFYNTVGELKYGLATPEGHGRRLNDKTVRQWVDDARRSGTVAVVMRSRAKMSNVNSPSCPTMAPAISKARW